MRTVRHFRVVFRGLVLPERLLAEAVRPPAIPFARPDLNQAPLNSTCVERSPHKVLYFDLKLPVGEPDVVDFVLRQTRKLTQMNKSIL